MSEESNAWSISDVYDDVMQALKWIQPSAFSYSTSFLAFKKELSLKYLGRLQNIRGKVTGVTKYNQIYLDDILQRVDEAILLASGSDSKMKRLPRLSQYVFKEKSVMLANLRKAASASRAVQKIIKINNESE